MLDGDSPEGYTNITANSHSPGTSPDEALQNSENPDSFWSPDPNETDDPVLTVDMISEEPATVTEVTFTVENAAAVEVKIITPDGTETLVSDQTTHRCSRN